MSGGHLHVCSVAAFARAIPEPPSPAQDRILEALGERRGRLRSEHELIAALYAEDESGGPLWADGNLRVQISRLRAKGHPVENVDYRGYRIGGGA